MDMEGIPLIFTTFNWVMMPYVTSPVTQFDSFESEMVDKIKMRVAWIDFEAEKLSYKYI